MHWISHGRVILKTSNILSMQEIILIWNHYRVKNVNCVSLKLMICTGRECVGSLRWDAEKGTFSQRLQSRFWATWNRIFRMPDKSSSSFSLHFIFLRECSILPFPKHSIHNATFIQTGAISDLSCSWNRGSEVRERCSNTAPEMRI